MSFAEQVAEVGKKRKELDDLLDSLWAEVETKVEAISKAFYRELALNSAAEPKPMVLTYDFDGLLHPCDPDRIRAMAYAFYIPGTDMRAVVKIACHFEVPEQQLDMYVHKGMRVVEVLSETAPEIDPEQVIRNMHSIVRKVLEEK